MVWDSFLSRMQSKSFLSPVVSWDFPGDFQYLLAFCRWYLGNISRRRTSFVPNILDIYYKRRHSDFKAYTSIGPIFTSFILQQHCHHHSHTERFKGFTRPSSCIYKSMLGTNPDVKSLTWRKKEHAVHNRTQYNTLSSSHFRKEVLRRKIRTQCLGVTANFKTPGFF